LLEFFALRLYIVPYGNGKRWFCQAAGKAGYIFNAMFAQNEKIRGVFMLSFDAGLLKEIDRILEQYVKIHDELETIWAERVVFTWHWWLDLALAVLPWVVWFIVRDRKKQHSLFYAGLFIMLIASLLDMAGVSQDGWGYNSHLLPYFPQYLPWDLTVFPVTAMLFYQYFPKINPWLKGAAFGLIAAYMIEPIFDWLGIYEPSSWEHHYSLPVYLAIYMIGYWLFSRSLRRSDNRRSHRNGVN
jgi:hypothetical protein